MHHQRSVWGPFLGVAIAIAIVFTLIVIFTLWEIAKEIFWTITRRRR